MEKEDTISVQWAQEHVETSYSLVNNNNFYLPTNTLNQLNLILIGTSGGL